MARKKLIQHLVQATGTNVSITSVRLGAGGIVVGNCIVGDPSKPLFVAERMVVEAPIGELLSEQPKLTSIRVDGAKLALNLRPDGTLIWPFESVQSASMSDQEFHAFNATVVVSQPGREDFVASGIDLHVTNQDASSHVAGVVSEALGSTWQIEGESDSAGETRLEARSTGCSFDTSELARFPGVPDGIDRIEAAGSSDVRILVHSDADSRLSAEIEIRNATLDFASANIKLNAIKADIAVDDGAVSLLLSTSELGTGTASGRAFIDLKRPARSGTFELTLDEVPADEMRLIAAIPHTVSGTATGELSGKFKLLPTGIDLSLDGSATVTGGKFTGINFAPFEVKSHIERVELRDSGPLSILGRLDFHQVQTIDLTIQKLAEAFPSSKEWLRHSSADELTVFGDITIPLESASEPLSWSAKGEMRADSIRWRDKEIGNVVGKFSFADGRISATDINAGVGDGNIVASIDIPLRDTAVTSISLKGTSVDIQTLSDLFLDVETENENSSSNETLQELNGRVAFKSSFEVPSATARNIATWTGNLEGSSKQLAWRGTSLTNLVMRSRLTAGVIEMTDFRVDSGQGTIRAKARIPLDDDEQAILSFVGKRFPANDIARLASATNANFRSWYENQERGATDPLVSGLLSFEGRLACQVSQAFDFHSWRGKLSADSPDFSIRSTLFSKVRFGAEFARGQIDQAHLDLGLDSEGTFRAAIVAPVDFNNEHAIAQGRMAWSDVQLSTVSNLLNRKADLSGTVSGEVKTRVPVSDFGDRSAYEADGELAVQTLRINGLELEEIEANVTIANSRLTLSPIQLPRVLSPFQARASLQLNPPYKFAANVSASDLKLGVILPPAKKAANLTGEVSGNARAIGNISDGQLELNGLINGTNLRTKDGELTNVTLRFATAGRDRLRFNGNAFGGRLVVEADLPTSKSANRLMLRVTDIAASELGRLLAVEGLSLSERISGNLTIADWNDPKSRKARIQLRGAAAQYRGIECTELTADLRINRQQTLYSLSGRVLGGRFTSKGEAPVGQLPMPSTLPFNLQLNEINLGHLESSRYATSKPLTGIADADLSLSLNTHNSEVSGTGDVSVRDVQWNHKRLIANATSNLELISNRLRLHGLRAFIGGGIVSGSIELPVGAGQGGTYELVARRIDLGTITKHLLPKLKMAPPSGRLSGRTSGRIGREIRGTATAEMAAVTWRKTKVTRLRVPFAYVLNPNSFGSWTGHFETERASARFKNGRVLTSASVDLGRRINVDIDTKLSKVEVNQLADVFRGFGQGNLSGTLRLTGRSIRSGRDLKGRFRGKLEDSQSLQFPVLSDLTRFATVGQMSQASFDSDEIDLRLANGIVSTPGIVLQSVRAELFVQGSVTLNQNLDLDIAMQTGNITPDFGTDGLLDISVARLAVPGAGVLLQAAEYLSNRAIYVHIGGTVRSPHVQLRTDRLIQDELIRFYFPNVNLHELRRLQ